MMGNFPGRNAQSARFGGLTALTLLSFAIFLISGTAWLTGTVHPYSVSFSDGWDISLDSKECILGLPSSDLPALLPVYLPPVTTLSALLPLVWIVLRYGRLGRSDSQGVCRVCGYDLRATPHRCLECGSRAEGPIKDIGIEELLAGKPNRRRRR